MTKQELAEYLANLDALMKAQEANGQPRSDTLALEYAKHWNLLKQEIKKGTEDGL